MPAVMYKLLKCAERFTVVQCAAENGPRGGEGVTVERQNQQIGKVLGSQTTATTAATAATTL